MPYTETNVKVCCLGNWVCGLSRVSRYSDILFISNDNGYIQISTGQYYQNGILTSFDVDKVCKNFAESLNYAYKTMFTFGYPISKYHYNKKPYDILIEENKENADNYWRSFIQREGIKEYKFPRLENYSDITLFDVKVVIGILKQTTTILNKINNDDSLKARYLESNKNEIISEYIKETEQSQNEIIDNFNDFILKQHNKKIDRTTITQSAEDVKDISKYADDETTKNVYLKIYELKQELEDKIAEIIQQHNKSVYGEIEEKQKLVKSDLINLLPVF